MTRLVATGLRKRYGGRNVVDGVSLELDAGEIVGLLGPNGAGKTTSFYMVVGLVSTDDGRVTLDGRDITTEAMHKRARMGLGYLAQEPSVFRSMTVSENVLAVLELSSNLKRKQRQARCESLLEQFGINHLRNNPALGLSGGERRRLEIARCLALKPKFILLDEPFAGIDPISVVEIQRIVAELAAQGIGILITDHNVRETLTICRHAYIISDGQVLTSGAPEQILQHEQVRKVYLGESFSM